jgi:glycosyltransferase involved in cell wall biosynthesis
MKILFLNHNQERFGTYFRCFNLGLSLAKKNIDITMVCASGKSFDLLIRKHKINKNFEIITLPRITYHKYFTGQIFRLFLTIPIVLFYPYDICHAFTVAQPQIAIPALCAKWICRKKLVIDWDDLWGGGFADQHSGIVTKALTFFENTTPKYADTITYVSEFLGGKLNTLGLLNRSTKIPNGIRNEKRLKISSANAQKILHLDSTYKYFISVGNTYFLGGLKVLFQAMAIIQKKRKNIRLIMLGYTDILPDVKKYFDLVKESVLLPGTVSYRDVQIYINASEAVILPMEENDIEKARFPIRLGDYLACGKPIISNAVGEVKYVLSKYKCGYIVGIKDSRKMSDLIIGISENRYNHALTNNAQRITKIYSWESLSVDLKNIYINLSKS